jgi:serine/threonine protein kinase
MGETDKFEHFVIARRGDGSLWELGRGAMGVTYKAFDTNLRADVALKVINSHFLNSETARQRFLREARAAASLRHPNVATVFHLGSADGGFYYAMEYVEGETVERRIQRAGPLSADLALRITRQVSRALVAADRQKLVHRDIKPSNLMLVVDDDDDHLLVKVIDFGLAKSLVATADQSLTISMGGFVGTPHFASPEQLEEKEIDIRSDIYSLGATLWFMLTGRPPFQGSLISVINQHLSQALSGEVLAQLHPEIAALLGRMLAKRPEDRFQSPTELKRRIDETLNLLRGDPGVASSGTGPSAADQTIGIRIGGTSSFGFATGELIRERYEILGRSTSDNSRFKGKDLQANRIVALTQLPLSLRTDNAQLELLRREIDRIKAAHHPNLLELFGLESYERGVFIVSEWIKGISLQDLLRTRRIMSWAEALRFAQPLSKVLDFASAKEILNGHLSLRAVSIENPRTSEDFSQLQRTPVTAWPPFIVKVDSLSLHGSFPGESAEPAQTLVDSGGFDSGATRVQQLAGIIHELLGGVRAGSAAGLHAPRLNPVANLSEAGNAVLRAGATEPSRFDSAADFLTKLEAAEVGNLPFVVAPPLRPEEHAAFVRTPPDPRPSPTLEAPEDSQPKTSPILLRMLLAAVGFFLLCAIGAVIGTNFFLHKPPPPPVSTTGSVMVTSKPDGASVTWNGKEIGKTPLDPYPFPAGKYTIELNLPGYQIRTVDLEVTQGSLNNLGVIPLIRDVGQLSLKSDPANLTVEVIDPLQKSSVGNTPMTLDNLPVGGYTVRMKRPGWPDYVQQVSVQANSVATVERSFKGVNVTLKSDPSGATIYLGQTELGTTPCAVQLPSQPVELVSRIGALGAVTRRVAPDPSGSTVIEFKHDYGTISLTSDRADAQVIVGGISLGTAPIEGIFPPGQHKIVVRAPGVPDVTRTVEIGSGQRAALEINFNIASRAGANLDAKLDDTNRDSDTDEATADQHSPRRYRTKEDFEHARDAAYDRFDAEWEARKNALKRAKDYYDYQADHSDGAVKDRWKRKKDEADHQLDELDDQKDAAKKTLKRQWNDD